MCASYVYYSLNFCAQTHMTGLPFFPAKCIWIWIPVFLSVSLWTKCALNQQHVWSSVLWFQKPLSVATKQTFVVGIEPKVTEVWFFSSNMVFPGCLLVARAPWDLEKEKHAKCVYANFTFICQEVIELIVLQENVGLHIGSQTLTLQEIFWANG